MISERFRNIKQSLSDAFGRLMHGGRPQDPPESYYDVDRQDLKAFVTNDSVENWGKKMPSLTLSRYWEACAEKILGGTKMMNEKEDVHKAADAVNAMAHIAQIIRETGNFEPVIRLPAQEIDLLAECEKPLHILKHRTYRPGDKRNHPDSPGNIDTLYFKAVPLFAPYGGRKMVMIPRDHLEAVVEPILEDLGITGKTRNPAAVGWERLGELLTDVNRYDFTAIDASGPYMLRTHMIGIAIALCKAGQNDGPIPVPERTIHGLEYTLHHLNYSINRLRNSSALHANGSDNAKALEILQTADQKIHREFAPWFEKPGQRPGDSYAMD